MSWWQRSWRLEPGRRRRHGFPNLRNGQEDAGSHKALGPWFYSGPTPHVRPTEHSMSASLGATPPTKCSRASLKQCPMKFLNLEEWNQPLNLELSAMMEINSSLSDFYCHPSAMLMGSAWVSPRSGPKHPSCSDALFLGVFPYFFSFYAGGDPTTPGKPSATQLHRNLSHSLLVSLQMTMACIRGHPEWLGQSAEAAINALSCVGVQGNSKSSW